MYGHREPIKGKGFIRKSLLMMKKSNDLKETLVEKALVKQDVFDITHDIFEELKLVLEEEIDHLKENIQNERVRLIFNNSGAYETRVTLGGDTILFHMHTNVFKFDENHASWNTSYVKKDPYRAYCGVINIYNFLADSFHYNRMNDQGYLIGRIFINKEKHFLVEGKGALGHQYRDFINKSLDKNTLLEVARTAISFAIDFELLVPPYEQVQLVSVAQMNQLNDNQQLKTGKRLGFRFGLENEE